MKIIELFSEITSGTAASFLEQMKSAGRDPVTIRINSPGGSIIPGMAMADAIRRHGNVVADVVGLAASMGSVLAVVARRTRISSTGLLMLHNAWQVTEGDATSLRKTADALEKISSSLVTYYQEKSGRPRAIVQDWMNAETWFTADEALAARLVDEVYKGADTKAALRWSNKYPALSTKLERASATPLSLFAQYSAMPSGPKRQEFFSRNKKALWEARKNFSI
jgi:ATP-dependent Clp protease protease subunit